MAVGASDAGLAGWLTDFLDLNAANDKQIVADYSLGRAAPCSTNPKTGLSSYSSGLA